MSNQEINISSSYPRDIGGLIYNLKHLGRLPDNYNAEPLYELLKHFNSEVRLHAVKNLGKLNLKLNTEVLYQLYQVETDTAVKREIVSSIGRQRLIKNKPLLFLFLNDIDPKIVCQAIRGLLVFENDIVFDPFGGSGTVGRTAKSLDRLFFITEKEQKYFEYMKSKAKQNESSIFGDRITRFLDLNQFVEISQ